MTIATYADQVITSARISTLIFTRLTNVTILETMIISNKQKEQ